MDKEELIKEWEKQIERCDRAIKRFKENGFDDLVRETEEFKQEAERELRLLR